MSSAELHDRLGQRFPLLTAVAAPCWRLVYQQPGGLPPHK
jgi:hypothetical protein